MKLDKDLKSIQEVRDLVRKSKVGQKELSTYSQEEINKITEVISKACEDKADILAESALKETGFGIYEDKISKNILASRIVYNYIKDMKTVGIINEDKENKILEIAVPMGIVAALIPSTNPTSTVINKVLISIKAGNSIIISPHPMAQNCIIQTVNIINEALEGVKAPKNIVQVISTPTLEATNELMKHPDTGIILATGGPGMVKAAYSSGNPAIGVGPGNGPAFIEQSANIQRAVMHIIESKTFDNGTICASEQSIVTEASIADEVIAEIKKQNGYFLDLEESKKVENILLRENGSMNPKIVGKNALEIADMAGIKVAQTTKVLLSAHTKVGKNYAYSREKLCPVLGFFVEDNWEKACERCMEILLNEGIGHTMTIHSENDLVVREFALKKPVMRLLVNTPATLGGVGLTTKLPPSFTLGCGAMGGSSTADNITPKNLIDIKRVAYGTSDLKDLDNDKELGSKDHFTPEDIKKITEEVINRLVKLK